MQEPIRRRVLSHRGPGSLGLIALLSSAAAALCLTPYELQRHHKTYNGDIELVYVFDGVALLQQQFPGIDGKRSYQLTLINAQPGEEPEEANAIGDVMRGDLVETISDGCWVELKTGRKMLLIGYAPFEEPTGSFGEFIKHREPLYWLMDDKSAVKARSLGELAKAAPELKPVLGALKIMKAPDFFNLTAKEVDKAAQSKAVTPAAGSIPPKKD